MCSLVGELARYADVLPKEGKIAYRVVKVDRKMSKMTALYMHDGQRKRQEYKIGGLETAKATAVERMQKRKCAEMYSNSGFYVYKTYREALSERWRTFGGDVGFSIARVRVFGRAVVYFNGMRCEKMIVESIVCGRRVKQ